MLKRTAHLTSLDPELESRINRTEPGMASWAEPSLKTTCGGCAFWADGTQHRRRCGKYTAMMNGRPGPLVPREARACKYFAAASTNSGG
jgi:hypothetical protein